jgi:hypothetical protein
LAKEFANVPVSTARVGKDFLPTAVLEGVVPGFELAGQGIFLGIGPGIGAGSVSCWPGGSRNVF